MWIGGREGKGGRQMALGESAAAGEGCCISEHSSAAIAGQPGVACTAAATALGPHSRQLLASAAGARTGSTAPFMVMDTLMRSSGIPSNSTCRRAGRRPQRSSPSAAQRGGRQAARVVASGSSVPSVPPPHSPHSSCSQQRVKQGAPQSSSGSGGSAPSCLPPSPPPPPPCPRRPSPAGGHCHTCGGKVVWGARRSA